MTGEGQQTRAAPTPILRHTPDRTTGRRRPSVAPLADGIRGRDPWAILRHESVLLNEALGRPRSPWRNHSLLPQDGRAHASRARCQREHLSADGRTRMTGLDTSRGCSVDATASDRWASGWPNSHGSARVRQLESGGLPGAGNVGSPTLGRGIWPVEDQHYRYRRQCGELKTPTPRISTVAQTVAPCSCPATTRPVAVWSRVRV